MILRAVLFDLKYVGFDFMPDKLQPENYAFFLEDIARKIPFLRRRYFEFRAFLACLRWRGYLFLVKSRVLQKQGLNLNGYACFNTCGFIC
jgi:hypothetical protein